MELTTGLVLVTACYLWLCSLRRPVFRSICWPPSCQEVSTRTCSYHHPALMQQLRECLVLTSASCWGQLGSDLGLVSLTLFPAKQIKACRARVLVKVRTLQDPRTLAAFCQCLQNLLPAPSPMYFLKCLLVVHTHNNTRYIQGCRKDGRNIFWPMCSSALTISHPHLAPCLIGMV